MAPDKQRKPARGEFGVDHVKERARSVPRRLPPKRPDDFTDNAITAAAHGDEPSSESYGPPPREDRAG